MIAIEIIQTAREMRDHSDMIRSKNKKIVLVPTMGYLHEGHLSLMREGKKRGGVLVVSIFVNPTQFGPAEDLDQYPRDFERDVELARDTGVEIIYNPSETEMYPDGYETFVTLQSLPQHLCGLSRPVFFRGVATVVTKLFNSVKPHIAVFGKKDYQQYRVIQKMVRDLDFGIEIIGMPIVREPDGLAMSSRNKYLSREERPRALALFKSLEDARKMVQQGVRETKKIVSAASDRIRAVPGAVIDYVTVCDPETLDDIERINGPVLMALAVKIGDTRLIDNAILTPET